MTRKFLLAATALVLGSAPALAQNFNGPARNVACKVMDVHDGTVADHVLCDNIYYGLPKAVPVTADGLAFAAGFSTTPIVGHVSNNMHNTLAIAQSQGRIVSLALGAEDIPCDVTKCGAKYVQRILTVSTDSSGSF